MNPNYTKLHDTLVKSPHNSNVSDQQQRNCHSHVDQSQVHSTAAYSSTRPAEVRSVGQIQDDGRSHGDVNKSPSDSNDQPPHTAHNSDAPFSLPVQSQHSSRESSHSMQHKDKRYNEIQRKQPYQAPKDTLNNDIPSGQSFQASKENICNDIPNAQSSTDKQYDDIPSGQPFPPTTSLDPLHTISRDARYIKLDLTRQQIRNLQYEEYKIAFLGAPHVGKSSIIRHFIDDQCTEGGYTQSTTLEQKKVFLRRVDNNKNYKLIVWDIGTADDSDINGANVFDKCEVAIIVFDVNEHRTLRAAGQCWEKVKEMVGDYPTNFLLVGNKCDLPEDDNVKKSKQKGRIFANEKDIQYYETSAKQEHINGIEIDKLFEKVVDKAIQARTQFQNNMRENRDDGDNINRGNRGICVLL